MSEKPSNVKKRDPQKAFIVKKLAESYGLSTREIYLIVEGERNNEAVFTDFMSMLEITNQPVNLLLKAVENLVPFN